MSPGESLFHDSVVGYVRLCLEQLARDARWEREREREIEREKGEEQRKEAGETKKKKRERERTRKRGNVWETGSFFFVVGNGYRVGERMTFESKLDTTRIFSKRIVA